MKLKFLASTTTDLKWMRFYYRRVFPDGAINAKQQYLKASSAILDNPLIGHASESIKDAREFYIARTPFSFVYRVTKDHIEIIRVIDGRSNWEERILQDE